MTEFGMVLRSIMVVIVVMVLVTIAATDFKELTFAEDEWEDLTGSLDAFNAGDVSAPLEEPGPLDDPGGGGIVVPDIILSIPGIREIAQATAAIANAIWSAVLVLVDVVGKGIASLLALSRFLFTIATFDIPALNAHPFLQMIRLLVVLPLWVGIPYLVVRMIRGGG